MIFFFVTLGAGIACLAWLVKKTSDVFRLEREQG
jgi:hypothetical protein